MKKAAIIMGSDSDWSVMQKAAVTLKDLSVPFEVHVYSAHRTPEEAAQFAAGAAENGFGVIIAGAGMSAAAGAEYGGRFFEENFAEFQKIYGKGPYMQDMYSLPGENLFNSFTANEAMSIHHHQIQCQFSVPAASIAVDMSSSYEETIKNALMLGLDKDTNACIAGGIAGAIYGVSDKVKQVVEGALMANGLVLNF